jgi:hypothetical protein
MLDPSHEKEWCTSHRERWSRVVLPIASLVAPIENSLVSK